MFIARQLCSERVKLLLTRLASSHRDVTEAERAQRLQQLQEGEALALNCFYFTPSSS